MKWFWLYFITPFFGCLASVEHSELEVMGRTGYVYRGRNDPVSAAVLVLHGSGGVASDMFNLGFEKFADSLGFLVVYPEMQKLRSDDWGYDNDLPYFAALATRLQQTDFGVPTDKLFICGHSAGGSMVTFLQNEMDEFSAAGVVSAAVGHLPMWNMSRHGHRTMVIWNHADPVLKEYAPDHSEPAYYKLTIDTLRRGGSSTPDKHKDLPLSETVVKSELLTFVAEHGLPELQVISWISVPGRHRWPLKRWTKSLSATKQLVTFFMSSEFAYIV